MIIFDQLRISDNGKLLYINAHVNKAEYFKDVYLESITIMTADKVLETAPETPTEDFIYKYEITGNQKEIALVIDRAVLDAAFNNLKSDGTPKDSTKPYAKIPYSGCGFSSDLFFVYIHCKGIHDECTPCPLSDYTTVGVTFDEGLLYQRVLGYTKELADTCSIPADFIDFILLWNAFKASVETDHFVPAIKYYNMLFGRKKDKDGNYYPYGPYGGGSKMRITSKGCGCHG